MKDLGNKIVEAAFRAKVDPELMKLNDSGEPVILEKIKERFTEIDGVPVAVHEGEPIPSRIKPDAKMGVDEFFDHLKVYGSPEEKKYFGQQQEPKTRPGVSTWTSAQKSEFISEHGHDEYTKLWEKDLAEPEDMTTWTVEQKARYVSEHGPEKYAEAYQRSMRHNKAIRERFKRKGLTR
jgi:hypothetical protein